MMGATRAGAARTGRASGETLRRREAPGLLSPPSFTACLPALLTPRLQAPAAAACEHTQPPPPFLQPAPPPAPRRCPPPSSRTAARPVEALVADPDEVVRVHRLDVGARLLDPPLHHERWAVGAASLIGEVPTHDCGVVLRRGYLIGDGGDRNRSRGGGNVMVGGGGEMIVKDSG